MLNLAWRNIRVFLRDRAGVFYSFLAVFIIIGLYVLFLGDMMARNVSDIPGGRTIMDNWIMAGMIAAATFTTPLGALGVMVDDRRLKIDKDIYASPLPRQSLAGGYMLSTVVLGMMLCVTTLILAEVYIVINGGTLLTVAQLLKSLGVMALSVLTTSAMMFFVVSFMDSGNAFAGLSTVSGTMIGFLTGIYIPIGSLPAPVQAVIKVFPTSHAAVLLRKIFMDQQMQTAFAGAPAEMVTGFRQELGVSLYSGSTEIAAWVNVAVLAGVFLLFAGLSVWRAYRMKRA